MDGSLLAALVVVGFIAAAVAVGVLVVPPVVMAAMARYRPTTRWRLQVGDWAKRHGWQAEVRPRVEWTERLPGRNPWGVTMLVTGSAGGHKVAVGNYTYTASSTASAASPPANRTHFLVVSVVEVPTPTPTVALYRRGPMSKFGRYVVGGPYTGTGNAAFDRRFRIESKTPDEARSLFGPALMAEHMAGRLPLWSLHDGTLLTYANGQFRKPAVVPAAVAPLVRVADLLGR